MIALPRQPYSDGPMLCVSCGQPGAVDYDSEPHCLRCIAAIEEQRAREDIAEQALAEAPRMVRSLAAGVRGRGSRFVYLVRVPSNQTAGALLTNGEGGEA